MNYLERGKMMSEKFTQGEWVAKQGCGCKIYSGNTLICLIKHAPNQDHGQQYNAHLIAAAPDMYRMLAGIVPLLPYDSDDDKLLADNIDKLLEKARGEHE